MSMERVRGVYLADTARVLGELDLGADVNVWYGAVIRGDVAPVTIGRQTNVQDGAVIHCDSEVSQMIGERVTIGHGAIVHGRSVGDRALVGMGATVLSGAKIGSDCLIAAGAVVAPGTSVPDGHLVMGVPGRVGREITDEERDYLAWLAPHYVELARHHAENPSDARVHSWRDGDGEGG